MLTRLPTNLVVFNLWLIVLKRPSESKDIYIMIHDRSKISTAQTNESNFMVGVSLQREEWSIMDHSISKVEIRCSNPVRVYKNGKVEEACRHSRPGLAHSSSVPGQWHGRFSVFCTLMET